MPKETTEPKMVDVEITCENHTHKTRPCKKGEVLSVTEDVATWLIEGNKGKKAAANAKPVHV